MHLILFDEGVSALQAARMLISSNKFVLFSVISCQIRHQHLSQNYFMPLKVQYCEKMVITYTRAALNAFSRYTLAKPLSQDLWGKLTKLHISRFPPTRRGKRAGQRKQRPIPVIISGSKMNIDFPSFALSPMVSNSIKSQEHYLHKPTKNQLNIQVPTSTVCKTNNIQVDC